jgi:hypothetical protein
MIGPIIVGAFALTCAFVVWDSYRFSRNIDLKVARAEGFLAGIKAIQDARVTELPDGRKVYWVEGVWE